MKIITAPDYYDIDPEDISVFLAGGITDCEDWQSKVIKHITTYEEKHPMDDLILFSPRRKDFDIMDRIQTEDQIKWEYKYIYEADIFSMYFCKNTVQPICLFELGKELVSRVRYNRSVDTLLVNVEKGYCRTDDVRYQIQCELHDLFGENSHIYEEHILALNSNTELCAARIIAAYYECKARRCLQNYKVCKTFCQ